MSIFKQFLDYCFTTRGDVAASMSSRYSIMTYPQALRYLAVAGIVLGIGNFWYVMHWPGSATIILASSFSVAFLCLLMLRVAALSIGSIVMWVGLAVIQIGYLFQTLHWPGGHTLALHGVYHYMTIVCAVGYLFYLPQEYLWSRRAMACWTIIPQFVLLGIYYGRSYVVNAYYPDFEPAIPYAEMNVYYLAGREAEDKLALIYGVVILACSIYLYIVARRQCKNG